MASFFLGANRGMTENPGNISGGTSTNSTDLELQINMTNNPTREDVIKFLRLLQEYILSNGLPDGAIGTYLPPM